MGFVWRIKYKRAKKKGGEYEINYVTIPKEIIYGKDLGDKRVIIYSYLCSRRALDDSVAFSINELVKWTGLVPNYHEGKINHKYLDVLNLLSCHDYFESCPNFTALKTIKGNGDTYYNAKLNIDKFDVANEFGIIYFDELQQIINFKDELKCRVPNLDTSRLSSAYILLLLSYIRMNMCRAENRPRCCFRLYKTIANDVGLSERYIGRIIDVLDALNIIKFGECKRGRYKTDEGYYTFSTTSKIFADYRRFKKDQYNNVCIDKDYDYKVEIKNQIAFLQKDVLQTEN